MKKSILALLCLTYIGVSNAQTNESPPKVGAILTLGVPTGTRYQHIDFPRKNMIIKRGAIANFKSLIGEKLVVENFVQDKNGVTMAILRRKDGLNFFRFYPRIRAEIKKALISKELKKEHKTKSISTKQILQ